MLLNIQYCYDASNVIEGLSSVAVKKHDRTTTVGMYAPNAWGLYDMHGNVDEFVEGSYESNYLQVPDNGAILATGSDSWVVRGGSWFSIAIDMYSAARTKVSIPGNRNIYTGFRVVRTVKNS